MIPPVIWGHKLTPRNVEQTYIETRGGNVTILLFISVSCDQPFFFLCDQPACAYIVRSAYEPRVINR